ncbi:hypothetical protein AAHE18_14G096200 [Arachis hypogaea]
MCLTSSASSQAILPCVILGSLLFPFGPALRCQLQICNRLPSQSFSDEQISRRSEINYLRCIPAPVTVIA